MLSFRKGLAFITFLLLSFPVLGSGDAVEGGLNPALTMNIIMWVCLAVLLTIGYKIAWGPILKQINDREEKISQGLEDAEKSTQKLVEIEAECKSILNEARREAKDVIVEAKAAADKLAIDINTKAQKEAQSQKEKAIAEIEAQKSASIQSLRQHSGELAIAIAGKILDKNLDDKAHKSLVDSLIKEI